MTGGQQEANSSRTTDVPRGSGGISCFIGRISGQYTPRNVSIGPYHRNNIPPLPGNVEKKECLDRILHSRSGEAPRDPSELKSEWKNELSRHVDRQERYYDFNSLSEEKEKHMPREDFLNMLLEDGCYILDKFVEPRAGGGGRSKDVDVDVRHDIIYLAENQIPFFILEKINGIIGWSESDKPLVGVFCSYIEQYVLKWYGYAIGRRCNGTPQPIHLLHLLHILLIGYQLQPAPTRDQSHETAIEMPPEPPHARRFLRWRRAKEYDMARVDLTGVDLISISELGPGPGGETRSILDVKPIRCCGVVGLKFPSLYIDRETWDMLGNLIGLEQGNRKTLSQRVTAYCVLMSQLACTGEDVELLSRWRVADHLMANDKECAEGFADLCNGVIFDLDDPSLNYLRTECVELDSRYRSRPSKWTAWMLREYCRNPCVAVASVVAIIFIAFGVLQAVYTVLKLRAGVK